MSSPFDVNVPSSAVVLDNNRLAAGIENPRRITRTVGEAALYAYNTSLHALGLVAPRSSYRERVINLMVNWLNEHLVK